MSRRKPWSESDDATLHRLRDIKRWQWEDIGKRLGRTGGACQTRYSDLRGGRTNERRNVHSEPAANVHVAADLIVARDARREASYRRTQTQEFFGDPPPGYSALDKKRAAQVQR